MKVKELIDALRGYDGEMDVFLVDVIGSLLPLHGLSDEYEDDGAVCLKVIHYFPDEWFYEDEEGSRWEVGE